MWQIVLGVQEALDYLGPAAVPKVTGGDVVYRAVLLCVSAGHNLTLDGSTHKRAQHLHCHSWHIHTQKKPCQFCYFSLMCSFVIFFFFKKKHPYGRQWQSLSPAGLCSETWWEQNKAHESTAKKKKKAESLKISHFYMVYTCDAELSRTCNGKLKPMEKQIIVTMFQFEAKYTPKKLCFNIVRPCRLLPPGKR